MDKKCKNLHKITIPMSNHIDELYNCYLKDISIFELLTKEEEIEITRISKTGGAEAEAAIEKMILSNLRLTIIIAKEFEGRGLEIKDLISEGNMGLMKAVEKYETGHGARLPTYAAWWIRQFIRRAIGNQSRTIRVPIHTNERNQKIYKIAQELHTKLGREPTNEEIEEETTIPIKNIERSRIQQLIPISIHTKVSDKGEELINTLVDQSKKTTEEELEERSNSIIIEILLKKLTPQEKAIISKRFGLKGEDIQILEQIGEEFDLSRERVRQIQESALKKLREGVKDLKLKKEEVLTS